MTKLIIIGLLVLAAVALAVWFLILQAQKDTLDKREMSINEDLEHLKKERDILEADQKTLKMLYEKTAPWVGKEYIIVTASYAVSESDEMKYNTDLAIRNVARNRIAHNLAFDIIKNFPEPVCEEVDGKKTFSYRLKVMEDK